MVKALISVLIILRERLQETVKLKREKEDLRGNFDQEIAEGSQANGKESTPYKNQKEVTAICPLQI